MLSRPEIGTHEHVKLWFDSKPEAESYVWLSADCAVGQYTKQFGYHFKDENLKWISDLAREQPHTWGALAERAQKAW